MPERTTLTDEGQTGKTAATERAAVLGARAGVAVPVQLLDDAGSWMAVCIAVGAGIGATAGARRTTW